MEADAISSTSRLPNNQWAKKNGQPYTAIIGQPFKIWNKQMDPN